nr:claudin-14 [Nothobranchius furzeri]
MARVALQLLGFLFGLLGLAGAVVAALLPHWRSTLYIGPDMITATAYMKGLWMECAWHSTNVYQCEEYRSLLALPPDLQAARALMVLSCISSALASLVTVAGMKCTNFVQSSGNKSALVLSGGVGFLCAGLLCLIPISWTTSDVTTDFHKPFFSGGMRYEIGLAVYLGYASACLSLTGGMVLCWSSKGDETKTHPYLQTGQPSSPPPAPPYKPPEDLKDYRAHSFSSLTSSGYGLENYV